MCTVSMVGDHYNNQFDQYRKVDSVSRVEFELLKQRVEEMILLLKRAKQYDIDNNEPDCEIEDKMKFLREVAKLVGVDLEEELEKKNNNE